jgi:hypothetical protein
MIQNGNNIRLYLDGNIVAKLTSSDVSYEREVLDATDKYSNDWRVIQMGNKSFTMNCEGFVVDPYDKNMITYSENFSNSYWTKTGLTISSTLVADPFGFIRAQQTVSASTGDTIFATSLNSEIGKTYTYSVWLRSVTGTLNVTIDLTNGTNTDVESITLTTSWTRYSATITATVAAPLVCSIDLAANGELRVFGAQLEVGSVATFYEPTGLRFIDLFQSINNGTKITALVTDSTTGNVEYEGQVYISNISQSAPQGQLTTFSCTLEGTSDVTKTTI